MPREISCNEPQSPCEGIQAHADQAEQLHAVWDRLGPHVELAARIRSRGMNADSREEFIQECRALAWSRYLRQAAKGRDVLANVKCWSYWLVRDVQRGESLNGSHRRRYAYQKRRRESRPGSDAITSKAAVEVKFQFRFPSGDGPGSQFWVDFLPERSRASIPGWVAFRVDFERWFRFRPRNQRRAIRLFLAGLGRGEVADCLGVDWKTVTRWRAIWRDSWQRFQGE